MERPTFTARPPAKVNLTLEILGRRPDGYHELRSIFLRIGLTDRLTLQAAPPDARDDRLTLSGLPGTPVAGNLVLRALAALRAHAGVHLPPLEATLEKRIPAAAGLGGGSSDAAAALAVAQACWGVGVSPADEAALASALGSDVPFFAIDAPAALVEGRGERLRALPGLEGNAGLLLVTPPVRLSTADAYARHDELGGPSDDASRPTAELAGALEAGLDGNALARWTERSRDANHLWPAAVSMAASLGLLREVLESSTARAWLMSGSGPTLFAVYPSVEAAAEAGRSMAETRSSHLENAYIHAVDLVGPDPAWRYP